MADLSTDAQVVLDAKRYRLLKAKAVKETAYDRYGNGCYWSIGLFSDESSKPFDDVIDDLINGPENVMVKARRADA